MFSALRAFIRRRFSGASPARRAPLPTYSALVDDGTRAVLAVSENTAALAYLSEVFLDTHHFLNVTWPNHMYDLPFPVHAPSLAGWSWSLNSRKFEPTRPDVLTPEIDARSRLAIKKLHAVAHIMRMLSIARSRLTPGILLQETVYLTKKIQAHAFRDGGYDERAIFQYPYVLQHADFAELSYKEAADDIILRAKLDDDFLAKSELLRLTYFAQLKSLTDPADIAPLLEAFTREAFTNAYV